MPDEVSLVHNGILFVDELTEFRWRVLDLTALFTLAVRLKASPASLPSP
jgi:Magnesium chelatase, subunit ChlI